MDKDAFYKPKIREELFENAMEAIDDFSFKFACFVDATKRFLQKVEDEIKEGKKNGKKKD